VGWAYVRQSNIQAAGLIPGGLPSAGQPYLFRFNNGQNAFAYQAILGVAYAIPSVPGLALTGEFRYYGLGSDVTYKGQFFAPGVATGARVKVGSENNYGILIGVRYAFNAAPPPPPPAPLPAPRTEAARTYLVFFDWDRADLTDRARQIIAEAAQATTRVQVTRIEVSGHTDTTGGAQYNQGLSVRRAQSVAAELVRLGVPKAAITTQGFGFSHPLVATGPNVREPQNRRVEIVLR
jgi:OOP family OmpA-OmpF porin